MSSRVPVLHEDIDLVAVAKPAGVTVIPAPRTPASACLHHRVAAERGERLWVVHRLDRDTSGVVVFARTAEAHRRLSQAFESREVRKTYLAFVRGRLEPPRGRIDIALHEARRGKSRPAASGEAGTRHAITDYVVRGTWDIGDGEISLVELSPATGRHHQLRVQLRAVGTPILFDAVYGRGATPRTLTDGPCRRLALHASRLDVPDAAGARLVIDAPLPEDVRALGDLVRTRGARTPDRATGGPDDEGAT
jgi:RluA family pseudouridine synthase